MAWTVGGGIGLAVAVSLAAGCGGEIASEDDGGSSGSSSGSASGTGTGSSGSSGADFIPCPTILPTPGTACSPPNHGCAYVDETSGTCQSFICQPSPQVWVSTTQGC